MFRSIVVSVLVAVGALAARPAQACRCEEPGPTRASYNRADIVVSGEVTSVIFEGRVDRTAVLTVDRVMKGEVSPGKPLPLFIGTSTCGLRELAQGEHWLLFLKRLPDGQLAARRCTGSMRLSAVGHEPDANDLRLLDRVAKLKTK